VVVVVVDGTVAGRTEAEDSSPSPSAMLAFESSTVWKAG
jgi:hypothetical protein